MQIDLRHGDCVEVMKTLADASVDAVVTDPPYELGFMGKGWDASGIAYSVAMWGEVLRVLKPGGHVLAFGGTRTYHRMAVAIEDAGFEVRDSLHWIYGSGFPKSLDVSKALNKAAGAEREVVGPNPYNNRRTNPPISDLHKQAGWPGNITAPATDAAKQWSGWGTALKPAHEPVVVARKPLIGTVADNVQTHRTGALNIDGCRIGFQSEADKSSAKPQGRATSKEKHIGAAPDAGNNESRVEFAVNQSDAGRWPPNILLSHTPECGEACAEDCPVAEMDRQSGVKTGKGTATVGGPPRSKSAHIQQMSEQPRTHAIMDYGDSGGASRFFPVFRYQAKASRSERGTDNKHPTVKPVALMRWLVRLVTPPGGVVLEPFMGSGTTGVACVQEGFDFVGIEREAEYFEICKARIAAAQSEAPVQKELF